MKQKRHNTDCLEIGEMIFEKINPIVNCYPLVAEKDTLFPFAVYRRTSFTGRDTKDRFNFEESVTIELTIASEKYKESIKLASQIKETLEYLQGIWRNTYISNINLINASENFINESYIQTLLFEIRIDNEKYKQIKSREN